MELGRFKNRIDLLATIGALFAALLFAVFYEGHGPPATTKSHIIHWTALVIFCTYRIIKNLLGHYMSWNLKNSYVLVCITHFSFYLFRSVAKLIYDQHYIKEYDLAVILSFLLIVIVETYGQQWKSKS
jgi:hypothetical protein